MFECESPIITMDGSRVKSLRTQNEFFDLWHHAPQARVLLRPLAEALGFALSEETKA